MFYEHNGVFLNGHLVKPANLTKAMVHLTVLVAA